MSLLPVFLMKLGKIDGDLIPKHMRDSPQLFMDVLGAPQTSPASPKVLEWVAVYTASVPVQAMQVVVATSPTQIVGGASAASRNRFMTRLGGKTLRVSATSFDELVAAAKRPFRLGAEEEP